MLVVAGIEHFEFGNEMFGFWSLPYGFDGFKYDGRDYGRAFSAVRRGLIEAFPGKKMSFGLVTSDDGEGSCLADSHICRYS